MESAREIADARLAKGDITAEEHRVLLGQIATPPPSAAKPTAANTAWRYVRNIVGGLLLLAAGIGVFAYVSVKDLRVGNITAIGPNILFRLANSSDRPGDVLFWIEQSDVRQCEHVMRVAANTTYNTRIRCGTLRSGQFQLRTQWASFDPGMSAVATRIQSAALPSN